MEQPNFDGPIAGMGLTHELGARPWQQPPQYSTVDEAMQFYGSKLENENFQDSLFDVLELGIPVTTIANSIQTSGTMQGKHSIDVGILVLPVLMESIALLADQAGIKYDMGIYDAHGGITIEDMGIDEKLDPNVIKPTKLALAMKKAADQENETDRMLDDSLERNMNEDMVESMIEEPQVPTGGLMGRSV